MSLTAGLREISFIGKTSEVDENLGGFVLILLLLCCL
jgi:hypothetical protein